jgi:hypothetical protein
MTVLLQVQFSRRAQIFDLKNVCRFISKWRFDHYCHGVGDGRLLAASWTAKHQVIAH